ncbi:MAG: phosphatase PAP2 family protein [Gammaproteobacteria bacterium]|nr:phosphatase PAP2 family protein [Gammaproteobacteria bacterium]
MPAIRLQSGFARLDAFEGRLCVPCNEAARIPLVRRYFTVISRLGDGVAWYAMLCVLPLVFGPAALGPTLAMGITALVGVGLYKLLKKTLVRERPFLSHLEVQPVTRPLDRYSFPSGHTMHATAFTLQLAMYFPEVMWIMLPFAVSVAASRVILGLHYPTDVLAGAVVGWGLAQISLFVGSLLGF